MRYTARVSVRCAARAHLHGTDRGARAEWHLHWRFGGLSLNALQSQPPSLGGTVTFNALPGIQIVGEAGRIGNVLPTSRTLCSRLRRRIFARRCSTARAA